MCSHTQLHNTADTQWPTVRIRNLRLYIKYTPCGTRGTTDLFDLLQKINYHYGYPSDDGVTTGYHSVYPPD